MKRVLIKTFEFPVVVIFLQLFCYLLITCSVCAILAGILPSLTYAEVIENPGMWLSTFTLGYLGLKLEN